MPPLGVGMTEGVTRRHCVECGVGFEPYPRADDTQTHCSHACRTRGWRRRVQNWDEKMTRAERVLERLRQGPATGLDLLKAGGGTRYGARVKELRDRGYGIETRLSGKWPTYRLVKE